MRIRFPWCVSEDLDNLVADVDLNFATKPCGWNRRHTVIVLRQAKLFATQQHPLAHHATLVHCVKCLLLKPRTDGRICRQLARCGTLRASHHSVQLPEWALKRYHAPILKW